MAKRDLTPAPTGNEVLMKAFEESKGKTVDVVVEQEVAGVTPEMFNWWMGKAIMPFYRAWWPEMHFAAELVMPPGAKEPRVIIKEMITPYYTEFRCGLIPGGISFLTPDDKKMGQLIHTPTASAKGIKMRSVFTFPATTPKSFLDAMYKHCKGEMQDFPKFLPELYKQQVKK